MRSAAYVYNRLNLAYTRLLKGEMEAIDRLIIQEWICQYANRLTEIGQQVGWFSMANRVYNCNMSWSDREVLIPILESALSSACEVLSKEEDVHVNEYA